MKVKSVKIGNTRTRTRKGTKKKAKKRNPVVDKKVRQDGVTEYTVRKIMTDKQIAKRLGTYFPESHYSVILKENADVYSIDDNGNKELLVSCRKKVLPEN